MLVLFLLIFNRFIFCVSTRFLYLDPTEHTTSKFWNWAFGACRPQPPLEAVPSALRAVQTPYLSFALSWETKALQDGRNSQQGCCDCCGNCGGGGGSCAICGYLRRRPLMTPRQTRRNDHNDHADLSTKLLANSYTSLEADEIDEAGARPTI